MFLLQVTYLTWRNWNESIQRYPRESHDIRKGQQLQSVAGKSLPRKSHVCDEGNIWRWKVSPVALIVI